MCVLSSSDEYFSSTTRYNRNQCGLSIGVSIEYKRLVYFFPLLRKRVILVFRCNYTDSILISGKTVVHWRTRRTILSMSKYSVQVCIQRNMDGRCVKHVYICKKNEFDVIVQYSGRLSEDYPIFLVHCCVSYLFSRESGYCDQASAWQL